MNDVNPTPKPTPPSSPSSLRAHVRFATKIILMVLFIASAACLIALTLQMRHQLTLLHETMQSRTQILQEQQANTAQRLTKTEQTLTQLQQNLPVYANDNRRWLLLKARYYIEMAHVNAQLNDPIQPAIALLQAADELLATEHDARALPIRQAISNEIAQWQTLPTMDVTGLFLKINAIQQHPLKATALRSSQMPTPLHASNTKTDTTIELWPRLKAALNRLVVIQHQTDAIIPMRLVPAHLAILDDCTVLRLEAAKWAIIQRNNVVYQQSLTDVIGSIQSTFDQNNPLVQARIQALMTLQRTPLTLSIPPISNKALSLINQWIETAGEPSP